MSRRKKILIAFSLIDLCIVITIFMLLKTTNLKQIIIPNPTLSPQQAQILIPQVPIPTPTPIPTPEIFPTTLIIPSLKISSSIETVGVTDVGSMDVPKNAIDVAWYQYGPKPGENGNAVMSGHYDTPLGKPAIFYNLKKMQIGQDLQVVFSDSSVVNFVVTGKEDVPYSPTPDKYSEYVFVKKPGTNLNLITCDGIWNPVNKRYSNRIIIYTSLK